LERFLECALFVAGLIFGSFLNVCISRIPRDQSIVTPRSRCPSCNAGIRWYDNIPLLSWLLLRGRCRDCNTGIPYRYFVVELATGILFIACFVVFGASWLCLKFCVFGFLLIGLIFMDAETGLLPREFTYLGIALGLAFSWVAINDYGGTAFLLRLFNQWVSDIHTLSLLDSVLGALIGAGFFYVAWALYYLTRKKHGLGFGDIALMGMSGAFLGVKLILLVIFCAPLLAVIYAAVLLVREMFRNKAASAESEMDAASPLLSREIPFGVFLGACSLAVVFMGQAIWSWYLGMFQ
jgi:leader peptidase (prepilin peptidase) / N-methyltransferase